MEHTKFIDNPMEDVFGIDKGTTVSSMQPIDTEPDEDLECENDEDAKIDRQLNTIYASAIMSFDAQNEITQTIDPKFAARNAEVAAQYLKIALDATDSRTKNKNEKAKIKITAGKNSGPDTINNNLIVSNRNDILKLIGKTTD